MNGKQRNVQSYDGEINLKELVIAIWKQKIMIICVTLVFALLVGLFSKFVISPVYDTKLNIVISMPEVYSTRYGEYTLPISTNEQYIDLIKSNDVLVNTVKDMEYDSAEVSLENLKKRITIGQVNTKVGTVQNSFEVTVSAGNPEESLKLAQKLYENYMEFMDVMTKERAVNYFINNFYKDIKTYEYLLDSDIEILKKNEELLAQTSQIIAKGEANLQIQSHLTEDTDYVVPVDTVNPSYIKIENDIVENKQAISNVENLIRMNKQYLEELNIEKQALDKYYETGRAEKLETSVIGVVETSVYLPSPPVAPTDKTSPSNALNTAIGLVIGFIIGVVTAMVKEFWFKEA
jgi:capsular polysaccharide biosynthesis protein